MWNYVKFTCIYFLFISRANVKAQTCATKGRTGPSCRFLCHCVENRCLFSGECQAGVKCVNGFFGFACQYVDITARQGQGRPLLVDYNDKTCINDQNVKSEIIKVTPNRFSFVHLVFQNESYIDKLLDFKIFLMYNSVEVPCLNRSLIFLQDNTLEVYCSKTSHVDTLLVKGSAVPLLCSVYVSGGRNLAVDSTVTPSSIYVPFRPEKVVDGRYVLTEGNFSSDMCFHSHSDKLPTVNVTFRTSILTDRVKIYNRPGVHSRRLVPFQLIFYDSSNKVVYNHSDKQGDKVVYTVFYNYSSAVKMLQLYTKKPQDGWVYINICEIEAYGDCYNGSGLSCATLCDKNCGASGCNVEGKCRNCPTNYTGSYCETKCPENCQIANDSLVCNPNTLRCIHGCREGFYGDDCRLKCSENCRHNKSCDRNNGSCHHGCVERYFGPTCSKACNSTCKNFTACHQLSGKCLEGCNAGHYGEYCSQDCSENCIPLKLCNDSTGACFERCKVGYYGERCTTECSANCRLNKNCDRETGTCHHGCVEGFFGLTCSSACLETCTACERNTGSCNFQCKNGFHGLNCHQECSPNCVNTACRSDTGNCLLGCHRGFYGHNCSDVCNETCDPLYGCELLTGECIVFCPPGYYGNKCEKECSKNCLITSTCNNKTGNCDRGCKRGYYLSNCSANCEDKCGENVMCSQNGDCQRACIDVGEVGYDCLVECHPNCNGRCDGKTKFCENGCIHGYYGPTCGKACPDVCRNHTCDDKTGECFECTRGNRGSRCREECDIECLNGECDRTTGQCHACPPGSAGPYCEVRCENCAGAGSCDQFTKVCVSGCVEGYTGETCVENESYETTELFTLASLLFGTVLLAVGLIFFLLRRMDWLRGTAEE